MDASQKEDDLPCAKSRNQDWNTWVIRNTQEGARCVGWSSFASVASSLLTQDTLQGVFVISSDCGGEVIW